MNFFSFSFSFTHLFTLNMFQNFNFLYFSGHLGQKSPLRVNWPICLLLVWSDFPITLYCFLNPNLIIWHCSQLFSVVFTIPIVSQLFLVLGSHSVPLENRAATDLAVSSRYCHPSLWLPTHLIFYALFLLFQFFLLVITINFCSRHF